MLICSLTSFSISRTWFNDRTAIEITLTEGGENVRYRYRLTRVQTIFGRYSDDEKDKPVNQLLPSEAHGFTH